MEVSAVNGATITFDTPLTYPFHKAYAAQLTVYTGATPLHGVGIEDLFIWGGMGRATSNSPDVPIVGSRMSSPLVERFARLHGGDIP